MTVAGARRLLAVAALTARAGAQREDGSCATDADCEYPNCNEELGMTFPVFCSAGICQHGEPTAHACGPPPAWWWELNKPPEPEPEPEPPTELELLTLRQVGERYQGNYVYPRQQQCAAWSETQPPPAASASSMAGHVMTPGMTMGRRRAQAAGGGGSSSTAPQIRKYYLAAEIVLWDYAPAGADLIKAASFAAPTPRPNAAAGQDGHAHDHSTGRRRRLQEDPHAAHMPGSWMASSRDPPMRIGRNYLKFVFKEYTDHTFTVPKPRAAEDEHLGLLGPNIRAEVGDTIQIVFRNHAPDGFPFSMHAHGVKYTKANEGAYYLDGSDLTGDAVPPGACAYYQWEVPESAGPGPGDSSTKGWLYHGHVSETGDTNAGLIGAIIIGRAGATRAADRKPTDVDREFVTLFSIIDENDSPLLYENARIWLGLGAAENATLLELQMDSGFKESNQMHAINGRVYGNLPGLTMTEGEVVRWHVMGLGNQEDIHTPHWHGQTLLLGSGYSGKRVDAVNILPATQLTLDGTMENPGTWLYHCHVNHHIHGGASRCCC
jgi:FtsP/CotA-like multicopper oxidase with cupredoxin domain